jgi:hypothetical protein
VSIVRSGDTVKTDICEFQHGTCFQLHVFALDLVSDLVHCIGYELGLILLVRSETTN